MHLHKLHLQRFRSFADGTVSFHPYLTALVGENNGGKSNVIDALRMIVQPMNGRRDIYCEESDIRRGATPESFVLKATFDGLSHAQKGLLISAVPDPVKDEAVFGLTFDMAVERHRSQYWAGKFQASPETGSTDLIRNIYLPPLRDAQRALASGNPTRIAALIRHFLGGQQEDLFAKDLQRNGSSPVLESINDAVKELLHDLTGGARSQEAALGFSGTETLNDIARDLRFKLSDAGIDPEELRHSGLGYANLLFMTTVIVELEKASDADLTLFLVEEPEAHLHPQLQMLVLDFLQEKARESAEKEVPEGQPAGRIQVIVTTHSPNLTAWVKPEHLVVMRATRYVEEPRPVSVAIPIQELGIKKRDLNKISRYLDVTRSAMVFGGRVLLVEGIAEALLIPAMAKRLFRDLMHPGSDRDSWKRFQGATIVAIDGVDFEPYVDLLLKPVCESRIADRVVVVTDKDPAVAGNRPQKLRDKVAVHGAAAFFSIHENTITLEESLYLPENEILLQAAYLDLHPRSKAKWKESIEDQPAAVRPRAFLKLFTTESNPVRKGDYAQALAGRLENNGDGDVPDFLVPTHGVDEKEAALAIALANYSAAQGAFKVPEYLEGAIRELVQ
jgi:putative ATP-dependent endonuclease of OLD family